MNKRLRNICFYYPSKRVGGAQLLFYRCADWLTRISDITILYADYDDGYIRGICQNKKIQFVNGENLTVPSDTVVILPLSMLLRYDVLFKLEDVYSTRFLFWSIHPLNLTAAFIIKNKFLMPWRKRKKAGKIIEKLSDLGIIRYMDFQNYNSVYKSFLIKESDDIVYLPIPFGDNDRILKQPVINWDIDKDELSFLWLSRLMLDKLSLILGLFEELDNLNINKRIVLHIVGDGDCQGIIEQESKKHNFVTIMHGRITGDGLDELIDSIDIGVAVGTSALEIAKRCKPVIMGAECRCDEKGKKLNKRQLKQYILLSQQIGFSVGTPIKYIPGQMIFTDLVSDILNNYEKKAIDCWNYVKNRHSIDKVGEFLLAGSLTSYAIDYDTMNMNLQSLKHVLCPYAAKIYKLRKFLS